MTTQTTRALGYFPSEGVIRVVEAPLPPIEADEVLVRITRVALIRRDYLLLKNPDAALPEGEKFIIPAHVAVGRVVETGSLIKEFRPGDVVVPTIRRDCNRCIDARSDLCPHPERYRDSGLLGAHGFARDFIKLRSRYLVRIPPHLEELALLLTPLSIAEKAHYEAVQVTRRFNFYCYHEPEDVAPRTLVSGLGPVGIMLSYLLSLYNHKLTVFGRREADDERSSILDPLDLEFINTARVPTERLEKAGYSFRQLFETTGDPGYIARIMPFMAPNAVMVLMGAPERVSRDETVPIQASHLLSRLVMGNQVILGSIKAGRDAFDSAVKHLVELDDLYRASLKSLFTHTFPFEKYEQALTLSTRDTIIPVLDLA